MWHIVNSTGSSIVLAMYGSLKERENGFTISILTETRKITCNSDDEFIVSESAILIGKRDKKGKIWSTIINMNKVESIDFME